MISIEGLDEVLERLDKLSDTQNVENSLQSACALVEGSAREKAPKDTGNLRRSIESRVENQGDSMQGVVFTPCEYGPYVEYGTGLFADGGGRTDVPWRYKDAAGNWHSTCGQPPKPFMRPALDENREEVMSILREGLLND